MSFASHGNSVIYALINDKELAFIRVLVAEVVDRFRNGEPVAEAVGTTVVDVSRQYPKRNPGIKPDQCKHEPFIIGDLIGLEPRFARAFSIPSVWTCVAKLLQCEPSELLFHFCNITSKPANIGPAIGWHRDADNTYFASDDGRTLRLLIPLQLMSPRNGGTAVVPTSHIQADKTIKNAVCPQVPAGAALALHSAILHGSSPNRSNQNRDVIVIQFGLRSSTLRHQAREAMSLSSREDLLIFYRDSIVKPDKNS